MKNGKKTKKVKKNKQPTLRELETEIFHKYIEVEKLKAKISEIQVSAVPLYSKRLSLYGKTHLDQFDTIKD